MPRISTDNYDTVASWNGSQDLFVVEQPDGTKVATPAMVKQFIEAGNFTATGEITDGHGNILKDMAKSADVNTALDNLIKIMDITVNSASIGHHTPFLSAGGAYYEPLVTYESIGVDPAKVLSIMPTNWTALQKAFTVYSGYTAIGAITDSSESIYKDGTSTLVLRIVYK